MSNLSNFCSPTIIFGMSSQAKWTFTCYPRFQALFRVIPSIKEVITSFHLKYIEPNEFQEWEDEPSVRAFELRSSIKGQVRGTEKHGVQKREKGILENFTGQLIWKA